METLKGLCCLHLKELLRDLIQLCSDHLKVYIQIQRLCADLIAAHIKHAVWRDGLVCFCVQKNACYISGIVLILIFHVSKYLIHISGVQRVLVILLLK